MLDVTAVQNPYRMGYLGVNVLKAMVDGDQAEVTSVVGANGFKDTGLGLVVPHDSKSVTSEFLVQFSDFKKDLDAKGLTTS